MEEGRRRQTCGLIELIQSSRQCILKPLCFFVSWQGVLTLAYRGFPVAVVELKEAIANQHPDLPKENPGSRWPKTTLAPLRDGKRLTPEQLRRLNGICRSHSLWLSGGERQEEYTEPVPQLAQSNALIFETAAIAIYECRSLEKLLAVQEIKMQGGLTRGGCGISAEEEGRVINIVREADDPEYWFAASRDGSRESHYRGPSLGCTLMLLLRKARTGNAALSFLQSRIEAFKEAVEIDLPGMYAWLHPDSYHVTLRALMG